MTINLPSPLVDAVSRGQSVLFVGAGFSHGVTGLNWNQLLERLRDRLPDGRGWAGLDALDKAQLFVQAHGRRSLERTLAGMLPGPTALRGCVTDVHRALINMPFPVIVTTNYDGLVEATLTDLDIPFRVIVDNDEVAEAASLQDDVRLVVKMHGDLLLGDTIVLTRDDYLNYEVTRPAMVTLLNSLLLSRPFVFYGFGLSDPNFHLIYHAVIQRNARGGRAFALMKEPNDLMARYWAGRGVTLVSGPTYTALEEMIRTLHDEVRRLQSAEWDLPTVLRAHFGDDSDEVVQMLDAVQRRFSERIRRFAPLLNPDPNTGRRPPMPDAAREEILGAFRALKALVKAGCPVSPATLHHAGDLLARLALYEPAREALELAMALTRRTGLKATIALRSSLGRVLSRLGAYDRAQVYLERALEEGDPDRPWDRLAELSWLCRCVQARIDYLHRSHRPAAAAEVLMAFIDRHSGWLPLLEGAPPEGDEAHHWAAYYANHRMGCLRALAAETLSVHPEVHARLAIEFLVRAIAMAPHKRASYERVRPLLLESRHLPPDRHRWTQLIDGAPPEVRLELKASTPSVQLRSGLGLGFGHDAGAQPHPQRS
ncbi:MAG: SIR2 family protein [Bradymonadia bacterium]